MLGPGPSSPPPEALREEGRAWTCWVERCLSCSVECWGGVPAGGQGPWAPSQVQRDGWSVWEVAFHMHHSGIEFTCNARAADLIPGSGRAPGGGNGNPLQYPCLENPMDGKAWRATVQGALKELHTAEWAAHTHLSPSLPGLAPGCWAGKRCPINTHSFPLWNDGRKHVSVCLWALSVQRHFNYLTPVVRELTIQSRISLLSLHCLYLRACTLHRVTNQETHMLISAPSEEGPGLPAAAWPPIRELPVPQTML